MTGIPLFIAEPTGTCQLVLRRFRFREDVVNQIGVTAIKHRHDASVIIDEDAPVTPRNPDGTKPVTDQRIPHDDPRWPASCACGEPFTDDDEWQVNELDWYKGRLRPRFAWGVGSWDGPPGAIIRAEYRDQPGRPPAWSIFLPNGRAWCTNDPSSSDGQLGPQWTVSGEAPRLTVSPSINDQGSRPWHGWIRDGALVDA